MEALVMMLKNTAKNTYHPILYFEKPLPGYPIMYFEKPGGDESEGNKKLIRYKSKGHRTEGFADRQEAINSIATEIEQRIKERGYNLNKELESDIIWDGVDLPIDVQTRRRGENSPNL